MVGYGESQIWLRAHLYEIFFPTLFSGHAERLFTRLHVNTERRLPGGRPDPRRSSLTIP